MEAGKVGLETHRERSFKMLADMGVQVWFSRPAARSAGLEAPLNPAADTTASATTQADAVPQCDPVAFHWAKGQAGLLLFAPYPDDASELMASDIVRALDWRFRQSSEDSVTQPVLGEFKWPQLLSSTGTPERSLHALLAKHLPGEARWLAMTRDIAQVVTPWLQPAPTTTLLQLVDVRSALDEPDVKRALWQQILTYKR